MLEEASFLSHCVTTMEKKTYDTCAVVSHSSTFMRIRLATRFLFLFNFFLVDATVVPVGLLAVKSFLEKDLLSFSGRVDFLPCGCVGGFSDQVMNRLLHHQSIPLSIKVKACEGKYVFLTTSSVVFFDSIAEFRKRVKKIQWQTNSFQRYRHLVYVFNATVSDIAANVKNGWLIDNVAFLLNETEKSIDLATHVHRTEVP